MKRIFEHYKEKYRLKTKLVFSQREQSVGNYNLVTNIINLNRYTRPVYMKPYHSMLYENIGGNFQTKNFNHMLLFTLLHEIKHAIDAKRCLLTLENLEGKYEYFQRRANRFARKEIKNYIKNHEKVHKKKLRKFSK